MPTKAKIKSINYHATATHLEVQAEPNGKKGIGGKVVGAL